MTRYASIHDTLAGAALLLLALLAGCAADEPFGASTDAESLEAMVTVAGGYPGASATRAADTPTYPYAPTVAGVCSADKLIVDLYAFKRGTIVGDIDNASMTWHSRYTANLVNTTTNANGGVDRYCALSVTPPKNAGSYFYYGVGALAYSDDESTLFNYSHGDNYTLSTLSLNGSTDAAGVSHYTTPELYYRWIQFTNSDLKWRDNVHGVFSLHNSEINASEPLRGTIYRLVSRFDITLTGVPVEALVKAQLYVDGFPTHISLYGNHGQHYYPVQALPATEAGTTLEDVLVDETTDFSDGNMHLSTLVLPSFCPLNFTVKVTLRNTDGTTKEKEMDIVPAEDATLSADNSTYVYSSAPANCKRDGLCMVYDATEGAFYSYANVRTSIVGEFNATYKVDAQIYVEPSYEKVHNITLTKPGAKR